MDNVKRKEVEYNNRIAEARTKTIEYMVKSLEAIQSDVILVSEFYRIFDSKHIDLKVAAHKAVGVRLVAAVNAGRSGENSAVREYLDLTLKRELSSLDTYAAGHWHANEHIEGAH